MLSKQIQHLLICSVYCLSNWYNVDVLAQANHTLITKQNQQPVTSLYKAKAQANLKLYNSQTKPINSAKTCSYAAMYLKNPKLYKWAGLAALASGEVGRQTESKKSQFDVTMSQYKINWIKLTKSVLDGNEAIYQDLFWQYLLVQDKGLEGIKQVYAEGGIDKNLLAAWTQILSEEEEEVWKGNTTLLHHEQYSIAQPMYDRNPGSFAIFSKFPEYFELTSPVPSQHSVFPSQKTIANFDDRWSWIKTDIWPAWRNYEGNSANFNLLINTYLRYCPSLKNQMEDFEIFIQRFSIDPLFQKTRIKFPLDWKEYLAEKTLVHHYSGNNWKYDPLLDPKSDDLKAFINKPNKDDLDKASVVTTCKGGACGYGKAYNFKRIEGKWYCTSGSTAND